jgi:hypothetical protein
MFGQFNGVFVPLNSITQTYQNVVNYPDQQIGHECSHGHGELPIDAQYSVLCCWHVRDVPSAQFSGQCVYAYADQWSLLWSCGVDKHSDAGLRLAEL